MKRLLRLLQWLLKAAIFFTLFAFALNNQQETRVNFFFSTFWAAPTVLVVLSAFSLGVMVGVLGMVPRWWRHRQTARQHLPTAKEATAADAVVSKFCRDYRKTYAFGPRERAALAETTYNVLRNKLRFDHFAPSGSGPKERRLAILGFAQQRKFLEGAINEQELAWIKKIDAIKTDELLERHRHNLPEWLVDPLKEQLDHKKGAGFWQYVDSLNDNPGLDLRVNMLNEKREDVAKELAKVGIKAEPTPYSPWGLRIAGKPALNKMEPFIRGEFEVQDEGSQLLAMLVDAKRGEMVVDFCAGAGGKTLAIGAAMRSTGRLYAFDTSAGRLDSFKPRMARSGLSNVHPAAIAHERDERVKRLCGKIDRVLVDAPCTGLGTLSRNPDLKWRQKPESHCRSRGQSNCHFGKCSAFVEVGWPFGLCHLQHAAARE